MACKGSGVQIPQLHQAQRIDSTPAQGRLSANCQQITVRACWSTLSGDPLEVVESLRVLEVPILSNGAHGPLELDEQSLNAVIVARGLLHRATLTPDGTAPGAIAAVILYDVAVETAAKAALRVVGPGRLTQQRYLPQVLDQLHAEYRVLQADDQAEWRALEDARQLMKTATGFSIMDPSHRLKTWTVPGFGLRIL
jgi:hypothetical protein